MTTEANVAGVGMQSQACFTALSRLLVALVTLLLPTEASELS